MICLSSIPNTKTYSALSSVISCLFATYTLHFHSKVIVWLFKLIYIA
jgi:hypothetical protein